ncbi:hypothetical protein N9N28_12635 [Rubripirellula amarantea]|nr:hypothetical protein [Rubripirellula amarantea]
MSPTQDNTLSKTGRWRIGCMADLHAEARKRLIRTGGEIESNQLLAGELIDRYRDYQTAARIHACSTKQWGDRDRLVARELCQHSHCVICSRVRTGKRQLSQAIAIQRFSDLVNSIRLKQFNYVLHLSPPASPRAEPEHIRAQINQIKEFRKLLAVYRSNSADAMIRAAKVGKRPSDYIKRTAIGPTVVAVHLLTPLGSPINTCSFHLHLNLD